MKQVAPCQNNVPARFFFALSRPSRNSLSVNNSTNGHRREIMKVTGIVCCAEKCVIMGATAAPMAQR